MAVPKRRQSKSRSRKRRSHQGIKPLQLVRCQQCQRRIPPHTVCPNCGNYMGRPLVTEEES